MAEYIAALDAGTTSSRAIIFDRSCGIVSSVQQEFRQIFPQPGWVEHDPKEIRDTQLKVLRLAIDRSGAKDGDIAAIGITNQRETTVVWNKTTGEPVYNAIVWQCRRTADMIEKLCADGLTDYVRRTTGLVADPYFSGSKIAWILDNVPGTRDMAERGELLFGTVDTWLIWILTGGRVHVTDYTNASRTMLYDIHGKCWDERLLEYFGIPKSMLPQVVSSSGVIGETDPGIIGMRIPIGGIAGDQQAALFGQGCTSPGDAKNTYGTGCFALMNTGDTAVESKNGLVTTLACGRKGEPVYALEGSVFIAGAAIQWLRDMMRIIDTAPESEKACLAVPDTGGVYIVPAFSGLGAPYWNPKARGTVVGITRGTRREHFIRATVESLAYQVYDLIRAMEADCGHTLSSLKVDGGAGANNFLMQFQADILGKCTVRPKVVETTAQGAAYLAGLAVGYWNDIDEAMSCRQIDRTFEPQMDEKKRLELLAGWERAVFAAMAHAK